MADDVVAIYRLKFKDMASKGLLRVADTAKKVVNGLSIAAAGVAAGAVAIAGTADRVANALTEQVNLAKSVGAAHKDFDVLRGVAKSLNFEFDNLIDLQEELNNKVGEFKVLGELTSLEEGLQGLNLKVADFVKLKPAAQMEALLRAAAKVDQQVASASADMLLGGEASKIFGKFNQELKDSGLTVDQFFQKQRDLNFLTDKAREGAVKYTKATKSLMTALSSLATEGFGRLSGIMAPVVERLVKFIIANKELINLRLNRFMGDLAKAAQEIDFSAISKRAAEFKEELVKLISKTSGLIEKYGGLKTIGKTLLGIFATAKVAGFIAALAPLAAILGGPILLAIGAVVAVGALLWKNWDTIKAKAESLGIDVDGVFAVIKAGAIILKDVFVMALKTMGTVAELSIQGIVGAFNLLRAGFDKSLAVAVKFRDGFLNVWDAVKLGVGLSINFMIDKINALLIQYNRIAASAVGSKIGLDQVNILQRVDVRRPAQDRIAATQAQTLRVAVDLSGKVAGAEEVEANVTSASLVNGRGGSNMPAGRSVVIP